ncbi:helix-turn-helix transcriptional regulator [Oceanobacillus sojae]|uniref:helix-turn-helix domain-containing protein n=1 Tax=Oceanobacillus sojae TaxID=582851 RepID=UPI0021A8E83F|nr:helix-turn-helix transcriptional regulator [Oceanobacillus sojae]MCT1905268.1 helix-turn-helix domain-containing protein [Oceanobacillus sojae]
MPLYTANDVPFTQKYSYHYIKEVRRLRNLTLEQFSNYMKTDVGTLSKLENQQLPFSVHYQSKFNEALQELKVSDFELSALKRVIELKKQRGI